MKKISCWRYKMIDWWSRFLIRSGTNYLCLKLENNKYIFRDFLVNSYRPPSTLKYLQGYIVIRYSNAQTIPNQYMSRNQSLLKYGWASSCRWESLMVNSVGQIVWLKSLIGALKHRSFREYVTNTIGTWPSSLMTAHVVYARQGTSSFSPYCHTSNPGFWWKVQMMQIPYFNPVDFSLWEHLNGEFGADQRPGSTTVTATSEEI
jgi:hypothetical protein